MPSFDSVAAGLPLVEDPELPGRRREALGRRCALGHVVGTAAAMFGVQRFDPLKQSDHTDVAEAVGGGFSQKLLLAREQAAAAAVEKRFGHLSGAQRRARAKAKAEGREYVPTARAAGAAPRVPKAAVAEETDDATPVHPVDPVRRGDKKRRVQDRLDDGNAVYKHRSDSTDDSSDAEEEDPVKRHKGAGGEATATEDLSDGAEADGAAPEADEEQLEKERRRRKKKKDKKKKKKAVEKNEERKRQKKAAVGKDPDADSDGEHEKPRKPKSERTNKVHELVRARAAAAQMRHDDEREIHGPLGQDEQDALDEDAALVAEADALQAADKNAPALSLDELQSRLTEATTTRPTAQYLNDQQQATNADDGIDADAAGLPSWLARAQRVVLPNDDEQDEAREQQGASGDILPTGPTLDEAGVGVDGSLSLAAQERLGVVRLWPAQAAAIPAILSHRGDVLLSAPTGSGKTLVYTLPILHALASRVAIRLRAVVVLPTRDLAMQVHSVFETLIDGGSLDVNLVAACGREKMADESARLCPGMADVVVGTPGRIVAHMRETEGFERQLSTVEWLVIDDADRLLQQSHQDWLPRLMAAVERKPGLAEQSKYADPEADSEAEIYHAGNPDLAAPAEQGCNGLPSGLSLCDYVVMSDPQVIDAEAALGWRRGVRKLILSATLTRHPAKLHSLRLHRPLHLHAATADDMSGSNKRFSLPTTLSERCAVVPPGGKPLALVLELQAHFSTGDSAGDGGTTDAGGVIVFAATVETSHRLARVLQLYGGVAVSEYSARLRPEDRRASLKRLADGTTQVLVCSDVLSRGIDVSGVTLVVNYDAPSHPKTYVHRVGRTARAGRRGAAITLLLREEVRFFSQLRKKAGLRAIKPAAIAAYRAVVAHNESAVARCTACLGELETVLAHESMQLLQPTADVAALAPDAGLDKVAQSGTDQTDDTVEESADGDGAQKHLKANAMPEQQVVRSGTETGTWGRQLVDLQRAQLVRHLQSVAR